MGCCWLDVLSAGLRWKVRLRGGAYPERLEKEKFVMGLFECSNCKARFRSAIEEVKASPYLSAKEKEMILGLNAMKLLGLG